MVTSVVLIADIEKKNGKHLSFVKKDMSECFYSINECSFNSFGANVIAIHKTLTNQLYHSKKKVKTLFTS